MSFNNWNFPPQTWRASDYDPGSWRPYANNSGGGAIRQPNARNGWNGWMVDPYFARQSHSQIHLRNYERNRMHMFNQPQAPFRPPPTPVHHSPPAKLAMSDFVRQKLLMHAHVPGLKTGQQMRDAMKERKRARETNEDLSKIYDVQPLKVKLLVASEKIEMRWEHTELKRNVKYTITYADVKTKTSKTIEKAPTSLFCEFKVTAGEKYRIDIKCIALGNSEILAHWGKEVRAEFSYSELKQLYMKCEDFLTQSGTKELKMHEFWVVYRCKPKVYWDEIHHYCNDVMQKYIKDENGQPANLINGMINGLFFSARLLPDLTLPGSSPFGNVRMTIDPFILLNPDYHNFYFSDFYCNKNIHYVTIVICMKDSDTDKYCKDRLMKLNPLRNPFIKLEPPQDMYGTWRFFINFSVWVELYFTENIELNVGQFTAITATGAGTSRIGGLPNNKNCTLCNLYPKNSKSPTIASTEEVSVPNENVELEEFPEVDTTMATILRTDKNAETEVADTVCYLVDRTEEECFSSDELIKKLDPELILSVEKMSKEVSAAKKTTNGGLLQKIAKNLTDFVDDFFKRRDHVIDIVKKLKET